MELLRSLWDGRTSDHPLRLSANDQRSNGDAPLIHQSVRSELTVQRRPTLAQEAPVTRFPKATNRASEVDTIAPAHQDIGDRFEITPSISG